MSVIYIPRAFGGTLVITTTPLPTSPVPTLLIVATFRDGEQTVQYRDGEVTTGDR